MACACKVNQKLDYIGKKYGPKGYTQKETNIRGDIVESIENFFLFVFGIISAPFMILHVLFNTLILGRKSLKINEIFNF